MNIIDKRATNPAAALNGTELVYVAQLGADAVTTVQDIKDFATNGFVAITDITPTSPGDNVGSKVKTDDNNVLQSCTSSTTSVTVSVLAVTAGTSFKPSVLINGVGATLTRNTGTDVWVGSAAITLTGTSPHTVTAVHGGGATDSAVVTIEAAPIISSLLFSNAYSQGVGQTQHAAGQSLSLSVVSDAPFVELEVIDDSGSATNALSQTFTATTSKTVTVVVANRGNSPTALPAKMRVRNANGTWSAITASNASVSDDETTVITLNNTRPSLTFSGMTYPVGQFALKGSESAIVGVVESNVDTVSYTSPNGQVSITNPTTLGNKTVSRAAGGYNITTTNLSVTVGKTSNATTANFDTVVWIADTPPVITKVLPAARLRSGISAQPHVIRLDSDQRLISIAMGAGTITGDAAGTFSGSWATANNGLTNTRTLSVADSDPKGTATFTGLSAINLAGREVTTVTTDLDYVLGGFVIRTVTVPSYHPSGNRQVAIGTAVTNTALLRASNLSKGGGSGSLNTTYLNSLVDTVDRFTITDSFGSLSSTGNTLYNLDLVNAQTNLSGTAQFEIEEVVS